MPPTRKCRKRQIVGTSQRLFKIRSMNQNTTYASMNFNKITLAFLEEEEHLFLKKYLSDSIFQFRIAFIILIILYGAFSYLDSRIVPEYATVFYAIRFIFVIPILFIVFLLSFTRVFQKVWQVLLLTGFIAGGFGISIMTMLAPTNYAYYAGMMLVFFAGYFFIKLRFFLATIAGWSILIMYNIGAIFYTTTTEELMITNNFFFISANLIGMFAAYNIEYFTRRNFFLTQRLNSERILVLDANKNLEITVKERTQELLKAKEKAEESSRLKTAFLQNMTHEIRTPLNAICGFTGLLNEPDLSDEDRKSFISIIQNSSNQLLSIVSNILTISSLETKQEKPNISKVSINNVMVELLSIYKQQSINQNISLYAKKELTDIQSEIFTDKTKITQILTNLLTNALKFTHDGFIEFGYKLIPEPATSENPAGVLQFYVKDTGIGINPELHEKIFERFLQADKSIQQNYGGTGLGLSISKGFVELLGGKIWVQSELTKGATFYFTIPYIPANDIHTSETPKKQIEEFKTVLVAENEDSNYLLIEQYLRKMNVKLIHAKDGKETVEICKANPQIDVVLIDIKMPIMPGDIAAQLIKEFRPDLPIIAQSGYALEHELDKYNRIFDDYISKPIKENELREKLLKYCAKSKSVG